MNEKLNVLADLIFPNIDKTIEDYEKIYPERDLSEGARVTRFAPSPTGFMHIGHFMQCLIDYVYAYNSKGVFYLRNEDTDKARENDQAVDFLFNLLDYYGFKPQEYQYKEKIVGNYGPYIQSERKEIYHAFIKHLIKIGRAYPCFCSKEDLDVMRSLQEKEKVRPGYYGSYAKCRNLSVDDAINKIKAGESYVIRFKSEGNFLEKFKFNDLVKGEIELPFNDQDIVIMKSDNLLPTYHFAHVVDDHLMHTTHVVRGEEWLPSVPLHIELFKAFGFKTPKYIHTPLILKKDGDTVRKISKRKDPEASMSFYMEKGYPTKAVIEAVMTIINSNYEEWHTANFDKEFLEFTYSPKKMSSSGAFFDLEKLNNISRNIISRMNKDELCDYALEWSSNFNKKLYNMITNDVDYFKSIINIEREKKKPRKDIANYSEIYDNIWYMYDEEFTKASYDFGNFDKEIIPALLTDYVDNYYDSSDDQDTWFNKIKELTIKYGYTTDMKDYKENPGKYKGSVADVSNVIRVALTTKDMTPNLYDIMSILGKEKVAKRFEMAIKSLK